MNEPMKKQPTAKATTAPTAKPMRSPTTSSIAAPTEELLTTPIMNPIMKQTMRTSTGRTNGMEPTSGSMGRAKGMGPTSGSTGRTKGMGPTSGSMGHAKGMGPTSGSVGHAKGMGPTSGSKGLAKTGVGLGRGAKVSAWAILWVSMLIGITLLIPWILVTKFHGSSDSILQTKPNIELQIEEKPLRIPVYLSKEKRIETVPLEYYIRGVVAAEMPIDFELEALKAQAIAARTYIVRRMLQKDFSNVPVAGAWVTDTVIHQAYITESELKKKWGFFKYAANIDKINKAVNETKGMIITYAGQPIVATFFSTSNGYTENSEDYWNAYIPYLRSVPSVWDEKISPKYTETVSFNYADFLHKFGVDRTLILPASTGRSMIQILSRTEGHRIKQVRIGNNTFSGREVREKMALKSSQFNWVIKGNEIIITTFGNGHGVGMSQWGANGMALEGKNNEDIIKYYYKGVQIERFKLG